MQPFVPAQFEVPPVSPDTASLFRRTPYISPTEYKQTPTAVAVTNLVPGGSEAENLGALAAIISRASGWVDTICFHRADGTLAASPATESGWIRPKDNGTLALICNYKPILEVDGLAIGINPSEMQDIGQQAAETLTITGQIVTLPSVSLSGQGNFPTFFPSRPTRNGRVYVVWRYVNGFPHTALAKNAKATDTSIEVAPSVPAGTTVYGVYPGTQLTIHDGANTEVVVVSSVAGLKLNLADPLAYEHKIPAAPDAIRVSAVPWDIEQATISLVSYLIKTRGTRAMVIPSASGGGAPGKQVPLQAGGAQDFETAWELLQPFIVPVMRST